MTPKTEIVPDQTEVVASQQATIERLIDFREAQGLEIEKLKAQLALRDTFRQGELEAMSKLQAELDAANASRAEMRLHCEQALELLCQSSSGLKYDPSWCRATAMPIVVMRDVCTQAYHTLHKALSTDCGKDWHPPQEWNALEAKCAEMRELLHRAARDIMEWQQLATNFRKSLGEKADFTPYCPTDRGISVSEKLRADIGKALAATDCGKDYVPKAELEKVQDQTDEEWLDSIGTHWQHLTGNPWETRDGECREEGLQQNISAIFQHFEENFVTKEQVKPLVEALTEFANNPLSQSMKDRSKQALARFKEIAPPTL